MYCPARCRHGLLSDAQFASLFLGTGYQYFLFSGTGGGLDDQPERYQFIRAVYYGAFY